MSWLAITNRDSRPMPFGFGFHPAFRWPLPGNKGASSSVWESWGRRFWPELAACYMLTAQKRVVTLTPVKRPWRSRLKVVGGIAEPTTRVSRIRFERHR